MKASLLSCITYYNSFSCYYYKILITEKIYICNALNVSSFSFLNHVFSPFSFNILRADNNTLSSDRCYYSYTDHAKNRKYKFKIIRKTSTLYKNITYNINKY